MGESPPEPVLEERTGGNRFNKDTGGRKMVGGRLGWCVRAMATEVVAAAAWRGACMRGAHITEVGEGGKAAESVCRRWAQCAMSLSCWTICWMISFSWQFNTPELRSCWTLCCRIEFFFPEKATQRGSVPDNLHPHTEPSEWFVITLQVPTSSEVSTSTMFLESANVCWVYLSLST